MSKYIFGYDILKNQNIDRDLTDIEVSHINLVRQRFRREIEEIIGQPILITTYIFDSNNQNIENLKNGFINLFNEIVMDIDRRLLRIFELEILICKFSRYSEILYPNGYLEKL